MPVPRRPGLQRTLDQPGLGEFFARFETRERPVFAEEVRAAGRCKFIGLYEPVFAVSVVACTKTHLKIGRVSREIGHGNRDVKREVDVGVGRTEQLELGHEQLTAERGRHGHAHAQALLLTGARRHLLQRSQARLHITEIGRPFNREREITQEQLDAQEVFQLPDAVADGADGDAKLLAGFACAAQPRDGLEGDEALDGRNASEAQAGLLWGHMVMSPEDTRLAPHPGASPVGRPPRLPRPTGLP